MEHRASPLQTTPPQIKRGVTLSQATPLQQINKPSWAISGPLDRRHQGGHDALGWLVIGLDPRQPFVDLREFLTLPQPSAMDRLIDDLANQGGVAHSPTLGERRQCLYYLGRQPERGCLHRSRVNPLAGFHLARRVMGVVVGSGPQVPPPSGEGPHASSSLSSSSPYLPQEGLYLAGSHATSSHDERFTVIIDRDHK
jgi:hypothetical protein